MELTRRVTRKHLIIKPVKRKGIGIVNRDVRMIGYYIPLSADIFPETVNRIAINEAAFIADFCPARGELR